MPIPDLDPAENQTKQAPQKDEMSCIEPEQGELVYGYYNDLLDETDRKSFEVHLLLCFQCQDKVSTLEAVDKVLAENKALLISPTDAAAVPAGYAPALEQEIIEG